MTRPLSFVLFGATLTACLLSFPTPHSIADDTPTAKADAASQDMVDSSNANKAGDAAKPSDTAKAGDAAKPSDPAVAKRQLSKELAALRDEVRPALAAHRKQAYGLRQNTPTEIMAYCLGFGCQTEVVMANGERSINGVTSLCWNYPCQGLDMLGPSEGHVAAKIGYGYQERPGEFLAMLAMSRVPASYQVRYGKTIRTVADLVESEKLACRAGSDLSLPLVGLSFYVDEPEWKDSMGGTWSIERMIREELAQPVVTAANGGMNRLVGLSVAIARREKHGQPIDGQFRRAKDFVDEFQHFAMNQQNADGSWGPYYVAAQATSPDGISQLATTGRVLEWLVLSLPDDRLQDPAIVRAVDCVAGLLSNRRYQSTTPTLATQEIVSVGHALHALSMYDDRVFKPCDAEEKPAEKPAAKQPAAAAQHSPADIAR